MNVLQELATQSGATAWAVGSMLFFLAAWVAVVAWILRKRPEDLERQARLPLEGDSGVRSRDSGGIGEQDSGRRDGPDSRIPTA